MDKGDIERFVKHSWNKREKKCLKYTQWFCIGRHIIKIPNIISIEAIEGRRTIAVSYIGKYK